MSSPACSNPSPNKVHESRRVPLGIYHGLRFGLVLHPLGAPELYLEGAATRHAPLSREHHGPRTILNAAERLTDTYEAQCAKAGQDLAIAQGQLRDHKARLGAPFIHDAYMEELTRLRDQLKAGLSGAAPEPGATPLPPVAELAERIKALRAAHTVEAAPQRLSSRSAACGRAARHRPHPPPDRCGFFPRPEPEPEVSASQSEPSPPPAEPAVAAESAEPAPLRDSLSQRRARTPGPAQDRLPGARRPGPAAERPPVEPVLAHAISWRIYDQSLSH